MIAKIFFLFALLAAAFAAPNPKPAPAPAPQFLTYTNGFDYAYPSGAVVSNLVSPYSASLAYSTAYGAPVFVR